MLARTSVVLLLVAGACTKNTGAKTRPPAPERPVVAAKPEIDAPWMRGFLERFADDEMQGRFSLDAASIDRAATMITTEYDALGIESTRLPFEFPGGSQVTRAHHMWVEASGPARALPHDHIVTLSHAVEATVVADVVFLPPRKVGPRPTGVAGKIVLVLDVPKPDADHAELREIAGHLAGAGARALVVVGDRTQLADATPWPLPVLALRTAGGESLATSAGTNLAKLGAEKSAKKLAGVRVSIASQFTERKATADNVVAWIPGTSAKNELVIVGAHYDHIGNRDAGQFCRGADDDVVCNGADDNGSGTAVVLAIAKAFVAAGYRPTRTIVFAHFAAEELGLHGSKALADTPPTSPPFAGARTVAMVNFDMVGRLGDKGLWVGGIGTSTAWMPLFGRIGTRGIPTVFERSVTSRSDHASFYKHEVPVLFFFTGLHDDYHRPGDELALVNYDGMTKIATIAVELVGALGDGAPITYAPPAEDEGLVSRMPGSDPHTVEAAPPQK
jgi:hypothetical protein